MTVRQQAWSWVTASAVLLGLLYFLGDVLTPFVAGMAIAYLLDPACDYLERLGCSRVVATCIITAIFMFIIIFYHIYPSPIIPRYATNN